MFFWERGAGGGAKLGLSHGLCFILRMLFKGNLTPKVGFRV